MGDRRGAVGFADILPQEPGRVRGRRRDVLAAPCGTWSTPSSVSTVRKYCSTVRIISAPAEVGSRPNRATESNARGIFSRR